MEDNAMRRQEHGFTLIEIIVTIVIVGIIAYIFLNFFSLGTGSYTLIETRSDVLQDERIVLDRMVREIRQAASTITITSATDISFPYDDNNDGINETYRYYLSGSNLRRTINGASDTLILDNVTSLTFSGDANRVTITFTVSRDGQSLTIQSRALRRTDLS
jgi:prepilin-type N-terminal cleavage/methylation domain-containing protein